MMRENGYYWVTISKRPKAEPIVAQWIDDLWFTTGCEAGEPDDTFVCASNRIVPGIKQQLPNRKVVQLATHNDTPEIFPTVIALCDDGTLWRLVLSTQLEHCTWDQLPAIPQS